MSISNFPDPIYVVCGSAWQTPFVEDDEITLNQISVAGNIIQYSEDGTSTPSDTNRLMLYINYPGTGNGNQWSLYGRTGGGNFYKMARFQVGGVGTAVVGTDYSFKEFQTNSVLINLGGTTFFTQSFLSKTTGNNVKASNIFKYMGSSPQGGGGGGGGGGGAATEMFFKCKQDQPFRNGYAVTNANITGDYNSKAPEREVNTFDSGLITNRLSGRFDDRGYYGR